MHVNGIDDNQGTLTKLNNFTSLAREKARAAAEELAAKSEFLLAEEAGLLEGDDVHEFTGQIKQTEIRACVDKETAAKGFELNLKEFGPYK